MNPLVPEIQRHLHELLGVPAGQPRQFLAQGLPFHILTSFDLVQLPLFGEQVLLAIDKAPGSLTPQDIASRINKIRTKEGLVIYVAGQLTHADRGRLIQYKVPFLVPGTQLYLPDLGIDLREHFRRRVALNPEVRWSPSTQALLFSHLLRLQASGSATCDWQVASTTQELGYTLMTGSRAASELVAAGLCEADRRGRSVFLKFQAADASGIWMDAKPFLRSPVLRTVWVPALDAGLRKVARVAGVAALAEHTLLHAPDHEIVAIRREDWTAIPERPTLARPEPGSVEIQLWRYSPAIEKASTSVDLLSLITSLRADSDERVQIALQALEDQLYGEGP